MRVDLPQLEAKNAHALEERVAALLYFLERLFSHAPRTH
jgi:hypothetical protein